MQDTYSRERVSTTFQAVVLENEHLRATFLPELGGRLVSLVHLPEERELLSRNPIFQPANLAIRNAWFSGGIEWNIGQYGHTFFTCSPVFAAEIRGPGGEPGLRLYEYERCKGLFWHIDFFLPTGSTELIAYARVVNCSRAETPFYWWTNVAVPETPGTRVLAPGKQVIYVDFSGPVAGHGWGELPHLPTLAGDASYSTNFTYASEYFFQLEQAPLPWEAALDEHGQGFFEASTPPHGLPQDVLLGHPHRRKALAALPYPCRATITWRSRAAWRPPRATACACRAGLPGIGCRSSAYFRGDPQPHPPGRFHCRIRLCGPGPAPAHPPGKPGKTAPGVRRPGGKAGGQAPAPGFRLGGARTGPAAQSSRMNCRFRRPSIFQQPRSRPSSKSGWT